MNYRTFRERDIDKLTHNFIIISQLLKTILYLTSDYYHIECLPNIRYIVVVDSTTWREVFDESKYY